MAKNCLLCEKPFNKTDRKPRIVPQCSDIACSSCIARSFNYTKKCPFCKIDISNYGKKQDYKTPTDKQIKKYYKSKQKDIEFQTSSVSSSKLFSRKSALQLEDGCGIVKNSLQDLKKTLTDTKQFQTGSLLLNTNLHKIKYRKVSDQTENCSGLRGGEDSKVVESQGPKSNVKLSQHEEEVKQEDEDEEEEENDDKTFPPLPKLEEFNKKKRIEQQEKSKSQTVEQHIQNENVNTSSHKGQINKQQQQIDNLSVHSVTNNQKNNQQQQQSQVFDLELPNQMIKVYCQQHPQKQIEYFCKQCEISVCSRCIFKNHNGHLLVQTHQIADDFSENTTQQLGMHSQVTQLNLQNQEGCQKTIESLQSFKSKQTNNIDEGFDEIIKAIQEKRSELKSQFTKKFNQQIEKMKQINQDIFVVKNALTNIYQALLKSDQFIKQNSPERILQKYALLQSLLKSSYTDLDGYLQAVSRMRSAIFVRVQMRPVKVNVSRAIRAIYKIQLYAANSDKVTLTSNTKPRSTNITTLQQDELYQRRAQKKVDQYFRKLPYPHSSNPSPQYNNNNRYRGESSLTPPIPPSSSNYYGSQTQQMSLTNQGGVQRYARMKQKSYSKSNYQLNRRNYNSAQGLRSNAINLQKTPGDFNFNSNNNNNSMLPPIRQKPSTHKVNQKRNSSAAQQQSALYHMQSANNLPSLIDMSPIHRYPYRNNLKQQQQQQYYYQNRQEDIASTLSSALPHSVPLTQQHQDFRHNIIAGFSDANFILKFSLDQLKWSRVEYQQNSGYDGSLKFFAMCVIPRKKLLLTGGTYSGQLLPTNFCFESFISYPNHFYQKRGMNVKRYGHQSVYLNGFVFSIGGFSSEEGISTEFNQQQQQFQYQQQQQEEKHIYRNDEQPPAVDVFSINLCQKYRVSQNKWYSISSMQHNRAFHSACAFNDQFLYVFGGIATKKSEQYTNQVQKSHPITLNTIQKYNQVIDTWNTLLLKLPRPLAMIGCITKDRSSILLLGGINGFSNDQQTEKTVYRFDVNSSKMMSLADMKQGRKFIGDPIMWKRAIYAVGGDKHGSVERYDVVRDEWRFVGGGNLTVLQQFIKDEGLWSEVQAGELGLDMWNYMQL